MACVHICHVYLVGYRAGVVVTETKHAHIDLKRRVVVQKYAHTRRQTNVEAEVARVGAGQVVAGAVANLALPTAKLELSLGKHTEARGAAQAEIAAEYCCAVVVVRYAVEVVDVIVRLRVENHIGTVEARALTAVAEAATGSQIVLETEQQGRADLKLICVAVDALKNQKLVIILIALGIAYAHSTNPGTLGHKADLLEIAPELLLSKRWQRGCNKHQ